MSDLEETLKKKLGEHVQECLTANDEITLEIKPTDLLAACKICRDDKQLQFRLLIDICGVDYLEYGLSEWQTESTSATGFSRGTDRAVDISERERFTEWNKPRFAVVYHLLSITHNQRVRIKVFLDESLRVPSVVSIWQCANWFEREAFDLYGFLFEAHPDLRLIAINN